MPTTPPIVLRGTLSASPSRVFQAWTSPDDMAAWWHPGDADVVPESVVLEPRVGGSLRLTVREADTLDVHQLHGRYLELEEPRSIALEYGFGTERHRVVATIEPEADGSNLTVALHCDADDAAATRIARAWSEALRELGRLVARAPRKA